jgi:hypothetical protein
LADQPEPRPQWPDDTEDPEYPYGAPLIGRSAGEVLGLCDEFFRSHASPAVLAELRRFLTGVGHHPVAGLGAFLTRLSSTTLDADTGRPRHRDIRRAAELTGLLARARFLPTGARTRDVGAYRALEVMVRGPGEYWATADVIDQEGSGHLEVMVATATRGRRSPWPTSNTPTTPG